MSPSWRAGLGVLLVAAATLALAGCSGDGGRDWQDDCTTTNGVIECAPEHRPPAPAIAGELLTGESYDLARERGQVVVVNFWGSWCAPCRAEADDLEATYQATKDQGVRFLGINIQDGRDKARAFEEAFKVSYPSLFDPPSRLALAFEVPPNSIPATIVLDRENRIAVVIRGSTKQETLQPIVSRIAAEQPAPGGAD
ncbi:TlpA disulfide reductase family protein [Micromonospora sp. HM5-17]|jgi:thiol-disulfide isomerase/thioredoxin|uniref:TlpA family protein disulfide reductase n=1 Tax=Micromonospora sp. HM5-17 TaxID=2487710 RepID=UPI000F49DBC4|nr:TlpA disulfide reductase family protein [Micromonospora sp. HM5-17]ROT33886.1 TlpA family protein disulfide reductase [Micromonospora sp. HM5-17]